MRASLLLLAVALILTDDVDLRAERTNRPSAGGDAHTLGLLAGRIEKSNEGRTNP